MGAEIRFCRTRVNPLSNASTLDQMAPRHGMSAGRTDNAPVFRRALRHSRHVRVLRVAIPIGVLLLVGAVALASWLEPLRVLYRLPGDAGTLVISGTKITMAQPKLSGYTRDNRWYEVTARAAAQDVTKPDIVELQEIRAKLEMQDKSTLDLTAREGVFDRKAGVLKLGQYILLVSSGGYEARLVEAVVDTGTGDIVSNKPVDVKMLQGTLSANRLEVTRAGEVVRFDGGVTLMLNAIDPQTGEVKAVNP